jgi:hypothetical protein
MAADGNAASELRDLLSQPRPFPRPLESIFPATPSTTLCNLDRSCRSKLPSNLASTTSTYSASGMIWPLARLSLARLARTLLLWKVTQFDNSGGSSARFYEPRYGTIDVIPPGAIGAKAEWRHCHLQRRPVLRAADGDDN